MLFQVLGFELLRKDSLLTFIVALDAMYDM